MALEVGGKRIVRRRRAGGGYELGPSRGDKDEYSNKRGSIAYSKAVSAARTEEKAAETAALASYETPEVLAQASLERPRAGFAITGSDRFINLYQERAPDFARVRRESLEQEGYRFASAPVSTEAGAGVLPLGYTVTGASQERPDVLYNAQLQDQQRRLGLVGTGPQRVAGRISAGLADFATRQYATGTPGTVGGEARIFAGDVARFIQPTFTRYAYGDTSLGRDITIGYSGGLVAGGIAQGAVSYAGYRGALQGAGTAITYARRARAAVTIGGLGLTGTYLATTPPSQVSRQLPLLAAGGFGYVRGARLATVPAIQTQTPAEFMGIRDIPELRPGPRTIPYRTPDTFAFATQQTQGQIYTVFGRPMAGQAQLQTGALLRGVIPGQLYQGPAAVARTDTIYGATPYTIRQTQAGDLSIDLSRGIFGLRTPQQQSVGLATSRTAAGNGLEIINTAIATRSGGTYTGTIQTTRLTPDVTYNVPGLETVSARRGGNIFSVTRPTVTQETTYTAFPLSTRGPRPISRDETAALIEAAGFQEPVGVPRSAVQTRPLYSDPTGGILTSLQPPRTTPRLWQPSRTGGRLLPPPGIGTTAPSLRITAPPSLFFGSLTGSRPERQTATGSILEPLISPDTRQTPRIAPGTQTNILPVTIPGFITSTRITPVQTPQRIPAQTPGIIPPTITPTGSTPPPPPGFPGLPGIPLFGLGGPVGSRGAPRRGAQYNPSLVSLFGDIQGEEIASVTGLEVRPRKKRRKKKKS